MPTGGYGWKPDVRASSLLALPLAEHGQWLFEIGSE
jgi:hypothetical protein